MQDRPEEQPVFDNPLRHLTTAQFMALGGNAVVYIRPIRGDQLAEFMADIADEDAAAEFQMVVSADGSPLLVADTTEAVDEWLSDKNLGIVALH
ncbi:MAG: DUF1150 family protein [Hyphomicrobiales bacterium]|nr:MAG: DUF1150 family protein [Hyphomicrobiales bacterium]